MYADALAALAAGATVVTPTRRLAGAIRRAWDASQQASGARTWPAPDVLPWSAWQQRLWEAAQFQVSHPLALLLASQQELALWARVIGESSAASALLHLESAAQSARQAWDTVCAWRLGPALRRIPLSDEAAAFRGWSEAFIHFCARESLLDSARLADELMGLLARGVAVPPAPLVVYGFDAIDPQRAALVEALRGRGVAVEVMRSPQPEGEAVVVAHPGARQELRAAALWARAILTRDPEASIGVVVPDLQRLRPDITRIFDEVLLPPAVLTPWSEQPRPWNLSLGLPLAQWPLVHAALLLLELAGGRLSTHAAGVLLRSPFLGAAESERSARALLDQRLRRQGEPSVAIEPIEYLARDERHASACPLLLEHLRLLRARARANRGALAPPSGWAPRLQSLLAAAGWPGERTLDSAEFQTLEAWRDLLTGLSHLDLIHGPLAYDSVLALVRRLAGERLFQPETPPVPVQVLGVLESAGLEFDHLMVLGLHAEAWPRPAHPNPLLPVELQRRAQTPGGCPEWELEFAQRMTSGWRKAAPDVVFSYPGSEDDRSLLPSPLLRPLHAVGREQIGICDGVDYRTVVHASRRLDSIEDVQGTALVPGIAVDGGAALIQNAAACPFRAFAAHRLGAAALEEPHEGLDARERGSLLHGALAQLWGELRSSERLIALSEQELNDEVTRAVDLALVRWQRRRGSVFRVRFLALERERLCALLLDWLRTEKARAPFEVAAVEEAREIEVGGIRLEVRLDRVDRLADGGELLLDYKTGEVAVKRWFGVRPDEPQLPLYTLARGQPPAALAFARVKRGESGFAGLGERSGIAPGVDSLSGAKAADAPGRWPDQLAAWRETLHALGEQLRSGLASVDPKHFPYTCQYCDLATLCRVYELRAQEAQDEDSGDSES